jgi:hypothetical protein
MRSALIFLSAAALAGASALAAPASAQAQPLGGSAFAGTGGGGGGEWSGDDGRRGLPRTVVIGGFGWNEGWALYNNRSFAPDSFNDWWHERPQRSFPRWM